MSRESQNSVAAGYSLSAVFNCRGQNGGQISSVRSKAYEKTDRFPDSDTVLTLNPFGGSYQSKNISNIFGPTHVTLVRISIVKKIRDGCGFLCLPSSPTSPSASPAIMVPVKKLVGGRGRGVAQKKGSSSCSLLWTVPFLPKMES